MSEQGIVTVLTALIGFASTICTLIITANRAAAKVATVAKVLDETKTQTEKKLDEIHTAVNGGLGSVLNALAVALEHTASREGTPAATAAATAAREASTAHDAQTKP